ncbi:MAG: fatty acid desaturase family protein [Bacteroidota bacterium]
MASFDARDLQLNIDKAKLKDLYQTQPQMHALDMLINWVIIIGTIYLSHTFFHPLTYLLAITIVGARLHALAILMHDATHFRFLKNRKLSDLVTNVFSMYPVFTSIEKYRKNHLSHHQHLNTEEDPDWVAKLGKREFTFPKSKTEFMLTVLSYFTMIQGIRDAMWFLRRFGGKSESDKQTKKNRQESIQKLTFYVIQFGLITAFGLWPVYLMYWIVPYLSTFFMFQYIRSVAEHFGEMEYDHLLTSTRTVKVNVLERFFIAPHNVGFHLEHHLYPGVPYYHLPELHKMLMETDLYNTKAHITQGYMSGLMQELGSYQKTSLA